MNAIRLAGSPRCIPESLSTANAIDTAFLFGPWVNTLKVRHSGHRGGAPDDRLAIRVTVGKPCRDRYWRQAERLRRSGQRLLRDVAGDGRSRPAPATAANHKRARRPGENPS